MKKFIVGAVTVSLLILQYTLAVGAEKVVVVPLGSNKIAGSKSYVWISGNGVRPFHQGDSTIIDMMNNGGAKIYRGGDIGKKNVMLPVTISGPFLGYPVTVTGLDIYWKGETELDVISAVLMRLQTAVNESSGYENLVYDHTDWTCNTEPDGCTIHYDITSNNTLTNYSGILYITIELAFSGESTKIEIGGARLTIMHE